MPRRLLPVLLALPLLCQSPAAPAPSQTQTQTQAQAQAQAQAPLLQSRCLGKAEAAQVLTGDDYFQLLQVAELRAKTGLPLEGLTPEKARSAAKLHYAAEAQDFSPAEEAVLRGVLARVAPKVAAKAPLMARTPFAFIKTGPGVEGGLPHTRGACIVLSDGLLRAMVALEQRGDLARLDAFAPSLLVHEQTHVLERQHPELFTPLFTDVFGFKRMAAVPDAAALQAARVVNPDGPDLGWAFPVPEATTTRWIRPDLLLKDLDHPRMPQDFREVAIGLVPKNGGYELALDAQGRPKVEDLGGVAAYSAAFLNVDESFHPNEIAAVLLAAWITDQERDPGQHLRVRTVAWAQKSLR